MANFTTVLLLFSTSLHSVLPPPPCACLYQYLYLGGKTCEFLLIIYAISWCRLAQLHRQHHERGEPPAGGPQDQGDESHRSGTLPEPPPQLIPPRAESIFYLIFVKVYKLFLVTPEVQIRSNFCNIFIT